MHHLARPMGPAWPSVIAVVPPPAAAPRSRASAALLRSTGVLSTTAMARMETDLP